MTTVTEAEILAGCQAAWPALFRDGLEPREKDGPATRAKMAEVIIQTRAILIAAEAIRDDIKARITIRALEQMQEKSGQAYQVLGYLDEVCGENPDTPKPPSAEWIRALDYFCDPDAFDENFLPWPKSVKQEDAEVEEKQISFLVETPPAQFSHIVRFLAGRDVPQASLDAAWRTITYPKF